MSTESFVDSAVDPPLRGFLHQATVASQAGLVLTHGAGANCRSPLLVAMAEAFAGAGFAVLRIDLPFRQARPFGPPHPGAASRDREGLRRAVEKMRTLVSGQVLLGGHSYGGRQASMLCAEDPALVEGLLLLSYPLHPDRKPEQLRVQHFPKLQTPALFVHGTRDSLGSIQEMQAALKAIPARTSLLVVENAGHDLGFKGKLRREELPGEVLRAFGEFIHCPSLQSS